MARTPRREMYLFLSRAARVPSSVVPEVEAALDAADITVVDISPADSSGIVEVNVAPRQAARSREVLISLEGRVNGLQIDDPEAAPGSWT